MATITNRKLTIAHDHSKKTVRPVVTCDVNFTELELCQMKACARTRFFKLKCELMGSDGGLFGGDDHLWTYSQVFYFPDPTPTATESRTFDKDAGGQTLVLGEGVLDEDWGQDEIYGRLKLVNLASLVAVTKSTNKVEHHF